MENVSVIFEEGRITSVGRREEIEAPAGARIIHAAQEIVAPSFIDMHIHGDKGRNVMEAFVAA